MRQIFPIPSQRAKFRVIVFCALVPMALLISCRREVELGQQPQQSPQPQAATEKPQHSQESQQSPQLQEPHARVVVDIRAVATLLEDYKSRNGAYPTTGQGLEALGAARKDPWQGDYIYQFPSTRGRESYDLFSAGPDRQPDTPDDDWGEE